MASYFNKTRGPVTVSLRTGEPSLVPPKGRLVVTEAQDGSASLLAMVRRGYLLRMEDPPPPPSPEPIESEEATPVIDTPSSKWTKADLMRYAEGMGLDVAGMTKAEILSAIEQR